MYIIGLILFFQGCIPQIMHLLDQVHSGQQQLLQLWQIKKAKLEQCLQLRIFEQDCEKVRIDDTVKSTPSRHGVQIGRIFASLGDCIYICSFLLQKSKPQRAVF
jgi:hypothetical protein